MDLILRILLSLVLATALAALALWRKALTRKGLFLAWALAAVIFFCGGWTGFFALTAVFLFTVGAGALKRRRKQARGEAALVAKTGRRDEVQIACNVATGALMLLLYAVTGWRGLLYGYAGAMAASLADSLASELGVLARHRPRDVLNRQFVPRGLSGGVTGFGFAMSAVGAAIVALICCVGWGWGTGLFLFFAVTAAGFLAALADSILGSAVQAKYHCPVCGGLTEKSVHCGCRGELIRGYAFMTNDLVNLCNNLIGAALGLLLFLIGV